MWTADRRTTLEESFERGSLMISFDPQGRPLADQRELSKVAAVRHAHLAALAENRGGPTPSTHRSSWKCTALRWLRTALSRPVGVLRQCPPPPLPVTAKAGDRR